MKKEEFLRGFEKKKVEVYSNPSIKNPAVTICVVTYQHVNYIKQCLDSILMQQTTFPFEILLGEDASTDGTRKICMEYAQKHRDKIRLFLHHRENNIAINGNPTGRFNFLYNLYNARGNYIALCEGDDYWTDPLKLQKQVDFLEGNKEYGICFHEAKIIWDQELKNNTIILNSDYKWNKMEVSKSDYVIADVFNGPFMATASVVFRKPIFDFPSWFCQTMSGDITLYALILGENKIKFINEIMCVYRRHEKGITVYHRGNKILINRIETLINLNEHYKNKYRNEIKFAISNYLKGLKKINLKELLIIIKMSFASNLITSKQLYRMIKVFFKSLYYKIIKR
tara:strand:+ start:8788 stop:9807 length:1020 start_codon:yes stop_codon:yes gene_type:complete